MLQKFGAVQSHMQFASDEATVEKIWQARKVSCSFFEFVIHHFA
jgi:hypothetical protein